MFSRIMGGPIGRTSALGFNGVVRLFMSRGVVRPLERSVLDMYLAPFRRVGSRAPTHIFPRQLRHAAPFLRNVADNLPRLADKPALIVWGEKDFAFQAPERSRFEQLFPKGRTVLLPEAGHFIQEDAPTEIVTAFRRWFRAPGADRPDSGRP
jgi:haloalkane dehalogenase